MPHTLYTAALVLVANAILLLQGADAWPVDPPFTLPATGTIKYMFVLTLPGVDVKTQPGLYYNRSSWVYRGFLSTLIVASYSNASAPGPIGPYSELVFIPGKFNPCAKAPELYYESVSRSWVDSKDAMEVGRYLGGMPKYMANFKWHLDPVTQLPVNITVRANKKHILSIIGLKPCSSTAGPAMPAQVIPPHTTAQWPIYPPGTRRPANDAPLIINTTINAGTGPAEAWHVDRVFIDALAFTGRTTGPAGGFYHSHEEQCGRGGGYILSAPEGSTATVTSQGELQCP